MLTDPIADFLIRIKNGYLARKKTVSAPYSKIKEELAKILVREGYIKSSKLKAQSSKIKTLILTLKYRDKEPALTDVKRVSKPGVRIYTKKQLVPRFLSGLGTIIISTPQGLMTSQEARKKGLGGEIICKIW